MRPDHRSEARIIVQSSERDKFPHIFLISTSRFQVRDVCQPFLFGRNIGELLELRARQAVFLIRNQVHSSSSLSNMIMGFIVLEKGTFLEGLSIQIKFMH